MTAKRTEIVPTRLEAVRGRFDVWRSTRKRGARIPEPLWQSAAKLARVYGVCRTARRLRLDYYGLKKRVGVDSSSRVREVKGAATFVELNPRASGGSAECIVELEDLQGSKMRVHLTGDCVPDVIALCRTFWNVEA
jgi:hypothetical protein